MKLLQGWKVRLYTFVTLFLFVFGAAATLWPREPATLNQGAVSNNTSVQRIGVSSKSDVNGIEIIKQPEKDSEVVDLGEVTRDTENTKKVTVTTPGQEKQNKRTASEVESQTDPEMKQADPKDEPQESQLPKASPTEKCGACGLLPSLTKRECPMTDKSIKLNLLYCRLEY